MFLWFFNFHLLHIFCILNWQPINIQPCSMGFATGGKTFFLWGGCMMVKVLPHSNRQLDDPMILFYNNKLIFHFRCMLMIFVRTNIVWSVISKMVGILMTWLLQQYLVMTNDFFMFSWIHVYLKSPCCCFSIITIGNEVAIKKEGYHVHLMVAFLSNNCMSHISDFFFIILKLYLWFKYQMNCCSATVLFWCPVSLFLYAFKLKKYTKTNVKIKHPKHDFFITFFLIYLLGWLTYCWIS